MSKILNDKLFLRDDVKRSSGLWARTEIIGGYGRKVGPNGLSSLDEVVFSKTNMVPLVGVQYAMEMLYGVKGPLTIPDLNTTMGIGAQGSTVLPSGNMPYAYGHKVCLFGVGTGGAAENNLTALEVKYNDTNVSDMVPFRFTNEIMPDTDANRYFGKKMVDGYSAYYLKRFDTDPLIRHLYKNGEGDEDGSELDNTFFDDPGNVGVQSLTETCLTISKKDVREWFEYNGNIELARVNSIGLFNAVYDEVQGDYAQIQLFSKLNIPSEPLFLSKDLNIIYRVYGA